MKQTMEEPSPLTDKDAYWMEIIEEWKQSGQPMSEWAQKREDITYPQLSSARRRLCRDEVRGTGKENTWSAITIPIPSTAITIHLNGCRIEVPPGFDQELLGEIVEVIRHAD